MKAEKNNWFYRSVDKPSVDYVAEKVTEMVDCTTSMMLVKATKEDVSRVSVLHHPYTE